MNIFAAESLGKSLNGSFSNGAGRESHAAELIVARSKDQGVETGEPSWSENAIGSLTLDFQPTTLEATNQSARRTASASTSWAELSSALEVSARSRSSGAALPK